jgi:hypothetical protein
MGNSCSNSTNQTTAEPQAVFDADAAMQRIASQLWTSIKGQHVVCLSLFAKALELVDALTQVSGAQKKRVLIGAFALLAGLAEKTDAALAAAVHNTGAVAEMAVDLVLGLTKSQTGESQQQVDVGAGVGVAGTLSATSSSSQKSGPDITALYTLGAQLVSLAQAARSSAGGILTPDAILALVPQIINALSAVQMFISAPVDQQVALATRLLADVQAAAPSNEQPAWAAVAMGVGPAIYAVNAARTHTLNVNSIIAAIEANPEQVAACCVSCFGIAATVASAISKSQKAPSSSPSSSPTVPVSVPVSASVSTSAAASSKAKASTPSKAPTSKRLVLGAAAHAGGARR